MFDDISYKFLLPGEVYYSGKPEMINTVLGSCVSVTMFCRRIGFGMISHSMLPNSKETFKMDDNCMKYIDCSILYMHKQLEDRGIKQSEVEVKIFGGSDMFEYNANGIPTVGAKNISAAIKNLETFKYFIMAKDIGGQFTRRLYFSTETGIVYMRKISRLQGV